MLLKVIKEIKYDYNKIIKAGEIVELIEECNSLESLNEREIFYIEKFNSRNEEIGYNIALGGNQISQDERVSNAISKAQKNNFSDPIKGKVLREKLSLVNKGKGFLVAT